MAASIKVDTNGDGIFDKDNDPLTLLPAITDETADGVLDVNLTAAESRAVIDGAIFQDAINVGSGTGNYNTFLALQDKNDAGDVETGFNAGVTSGPDPTPEDTSNTEMDASKSNAILLGAIPIIIGTGTGPGGNGGEIGVAYYEFRTDLNENNNDIHPQLSLDQFKLFVGGFDLDPGAGVDLVDTFAELNSLTKVYDMDGMNGEHNVSVLMNEANSSGSGTDDYSVLVPTSNFGNADPATTYVYLFVEMGIADGSPPDEWGVSGGFHEWNLQNAVIIQGTKFNDANGNGVQDTGETGMAGVTIYIDNDLDGIVEATDNNGVLDAGEQFDVTDANGNYSFGGIPVFDADYTIHIREVVPAGAVPTTTLPVAVVIDKDLGAGTIIDSGDFPGLLIGNRLLTPSVSITKSASGYGDCADTAGETILYTIVVDNDGDLTLTNVVLSDNFEGGGDVTITLVADDGDGILELGEVFRTGDTNGNNQLETTETWTYTYLRSVTQAQIDSNGGGDGVLTDVATVNADSANGSVTDNDDASVDVCQEPALSIVKSATVPGDCANVVGELIAYTIVLDNIGNVALDNVVLTDSFEGGADVTITPTLDDGDGILELGEVFLTGDTGGDLIMGVDETWTYTYLRAVTQEDIDSNGYGNGTLDNTATANADAVNSDEAADEVTDDASVNVCRTIAVDLTKYVDVGFGFDDANTGPGPENVNVGGDVDFMITLENTGNVTLTAVDVVDTYLSDGLPGTPNLLVDDGALTAYALAHGAVLTGDDDDGDAGTGINADGILQVGETWTITYTEAFDPLSFDPGAHLNTADVTTGEGATDEDSAYYFTLIDGEGPGVRTPGFWQNPNNGGQFWNGITGDAKNDGGPCFPVDDLLRIDSDQDGDIDENDTGFSMHNGVLGLFIGDYDRDGVQDAGEDILFISRTDAMNLLSSNTKAMNDMAVKIGRDAVATWLNYLAGNEIGEDPDASHYSPKEAINDAIDYLQTYAGVLNGGSSETWDIYKPNHAAVTNKNKPAEFAAGTPIHNALDEYNNFGTINGHEWAHDCDDAEFVQALTAYHSAHHDLF